MPNEILELIEAVAQMTYVASEDWKPRFDSLDDLNRFYRVEGGPVTVKLLDSIEVNN